MKLAIVGSDEVFFGPVEVLNRLGIDVALHILLGFSLNEAGKHQVSEEQKDSNEQSEQFATKAKHILVGRICFSDASDSYAQYVQSD